MSPKFGKHRNRKPDGTTAPFATHPQSLSTLAVHQLPLLPVPVTATSCSLPPTGSALFSSETPTPIYSPQEVWDHFPLESLSFGGTTLDQVFHGPTMLAELTLSDPIWVGNFMAGRVEPPA